MNEFVYISGIESEHDRKTEVPRIPKSAKTQAPPTFNKPLMNTKVKEGQLVKWVSWPCDRLENILSRYSNFWNVIFILISAPCSFYVVQNDWKNKFYNFLNFKRYNYLAHWIPPRSYFGKMFVQILIFWNIFFFNTVLCVCHELVVEIIPDCVISCRLFRGSGCQTPSVLFFVFLFSAW